jgi:hypothetical protein
MDVAVPGAVVEGFERHIAASTCLIRTTGTFWPPPSKRGPT